MENKNLWEEAENLCLDLTIKILSKETVPTAETVEVAQKLVNMAAYTDVVNRRRWSEIQTYEDIRRRFDKGGKKLRNG